MLKILPTPEDLESNVAQSGLKGRERASEREKGGRGETIKASEDTERVKSRATANISQQIKPSTSQEQHASIAVSASFRFACGVVLPISHTTRTKY